jgi:hypothetical protein
MLGDTEYCCCARTASVRVKDGIDMHVINGVNLFPEFIGHPLAGTYELLNGNCGPASFPLAPLYSLIATCSSKYFFPFC